MNPRLLFPLAMGIFLVALSTTARATCTNGQCCVKLDASSEPYQNSPDNHRWTYRFSIRNTCGYQVSYRLCAYSTVNGASPGLGWICGTATGPNAAGWLGANEARRLMPETWDIESLNVRISDCKAPLAVANTPSTDNQPDQCGKCPSPGLCGN